MDRSSYFDVDKFVDTMGNVRLEFLQTAFLMLKPFANLIEKPINLMENIHRDEFLDDYLQGKIIWPATLDSPSAAGLKKNSGHEPLTGSSSAPIETRQFRST